MSTRDRLLAALVATLWGFNFVVIDWGMASHDGHRIPPLLFASLRFLLVAVPACLLVPRPQVPFRVVAAVGAFMSLGQFGLLYTSMAAGMPPGLAALVLQAQVVLTVVIAAGVLRERPSLTVCVGVAVGAVGLVVVAAGRGGHVPAGALLLCLAAALSWAVGNVVSRAARVPGGLGLTVWSATVVPVPLLGLSLLVDGPGGLRQGAEGFGWHAALATLYTVVLCSIVGYAVFNSLLARNPAASVVPWVLLAPVVAMAAAWPLNGEVPSRPELVGGALLVAGALVAQRGPRRRVLAPADGDPADGGPLPVAAPAGAGIADQARPDSV